ncbi:MAG: hypothetical protein WC473_00015 [Patescibacteria group bacterium]|jgi:hypothetical protein
MLVTSKDLFWVVLSFVILFGGICTSFAIFYFAMILRDGWYITKAIRRKVEAVEKVMTAFKSKVENTASFVPPLIDGVSKLIEAVAEKKRSSATKAGKKSKRK